MPPDSRDRPKARLLGGVRPLPTMITLGNLLCGFGAIALAMRTYNPPHGFYDFESPDCLYWSGILIFMAMAFDVLDGHVARWTRNTSRFGMEMDSLADVVSFGVAPAVLVKAAIDHCGRLQGYPLLDRFVWLLLAPYVCCAALRLARYNVEAETGRRDFFFGLPSPAAAGCVASLVVMITPAARHIPDLRAPRALQGTINRLELWCSHCSDEILIALPFVLLAFGLLMVSRIHYPHVGDRLLGGRRSLIHVLWLILALVLVVIQHKVVLALAFNGYMLFGLANEVRYQLFPSTRPAEWISSDEEVAGRRVTEPSGEAPAGQAPATGDGAGPERAGAAGPGR
jgi:CDP-diacylglycerol--serine O-phosphatidyltransferase